MFMVNSKPPDGRIFTHTTTTMIRYETLLDSVECATKVCPKDYFSFWKKKKRVLSKCLGILRDVNYK